ncbi:hypothetical protein AN958_00232 [Leucoagaricus sp. SymC.cos]|nr:hypothetical protein AN958_00232 [Leucoagaricus sp. SymC.cos]
MIYTGTSTARHEIIPSAKPRGSRFHRNLFLEGGLNLGSYSQDHKVNHIRPARRAFNTPSFER